jgi:hypothetical protein
MGRKWTLLFTLLACACCASAPKARIFDARPLEPEGFYRMIYDSVYECASRLQQLRDIPFGKIEWYIVQHDAIPGVAGLWTTPNRIYLDYDYVLDQRVIQHELAHALLKPGYNDHDAPSFKLCAGVPHASN